MPNGRLLVLDDDVAVAQTISFVAEAYGMEARSVSNPEDFFRDVIDWQPTHVAVDLIMPEMDGVEVLQYLAKLQCKSFVIITSGVGERVLDAARRSAAEHELNILGVLPKPFTPSGLRALLGKSNDSAGETQAPKRSERPVSPEVTEADLRIAIAQQQFVLFYQPKIDCRTGLLAGFEALIRWHRPGVGIVVPDSFIPIAESHGLIEPITEQIIEDGIRWLATTFPILGVGLSINLSAKSLVDPRLVDRISALCAKYRIDPDRLTFELTESSAMHDPVAALDLLTRLRVKKFHLSIDDFGTGFSSMLQLVRLPFSEIKVDKSFVMASNRSAEARIVIKTIVDLGRSLGLSSTAEGVEDEGALNYVKDIGCNFAQGYYIARPMPKEAVADWIAQWESRDLLVN